MLCAGEGVQHMQLHRGAVLLSRDNLKWKGKPQYCSSLQGAQNNRATGDTGHSR